MRSKNALKNQINLSNWLKSAGPHGKPGLPTGELQEKVALSDSDPKLRMEAIKDLGISGGSSATLTKIYQNDQNPDVRSAVINALFIKGDAHSLVELARKETNPELKRELVQKMSVMGNREATDYLMEILNK